MEDKKIVIEVEAASKGFDSTKMSLKELKAELKSAQSAALNGDGKAAKRVAELKDKMEDLRDTTKSMQGSGVEKVSNSFGLLGQGLKDMDLDKIKTGFKGVGAAMSAIPIFLIVEGIMHLIQNFDELSKGNGVLAKALRVVGDLFSWVGEKITEFTDFLGLSNSALDKLGDSIKTNAEKGKEALNEQTAEFDRQMRVAKAAGKSTLELEQAKQQAIIDTNVAVARQIEAFVRAGGELDDEKRKLLTASLNAIKDAKVNEYVIEQDHTNKLKEEYKKRTDDKKKLEAEEREKKKAEQARLADIENAAIDKAEADDKRLAESRKKNLQELNALQLKADQDEVASNIAKWTEDDRLRKQAIADEQHANATKLQIASDTTTALAGLSDVIFSIRNANTKKGSAAEEKAARAQFKVNKALGIAAAGINGLQSILAITSVPDPTLGIASAIRIAAQIATTAATIAKISATQFQPSGGGDTSAPSIPTPNLGGGNAPTTQAPSTGAQPFTRLDESGRNQGMPMIKTYVLESEMTGSQRRVNKLERQATFG